MTFAYADGVKVVFLIAELPCFPSKRAESVVVIYCSQFTSHQPLLFTVVIKRTLENLLPCFPKIRNSFCYRNSLLILAII